MAPNLLLISVDRAYLIQGGYPLTLTELSETPKVNSTEVKADVSVPSQKVAGHNPAKSALNSRESSRNSWLIAEFLH